MAQTNLNVYTIKFIRITRTPDLCIPHLTNPGLNKLEFLLNQLCMTYLFTKRGGAFTYFSALKKTCFLKSMLSLNFPTQFYIHEKKFIMTRR